MRFAPNTLYFHKDLAPERQLERIRKAGFQGVEILFPYMYPLDALSGWLRGLGLEVSVIDVLPGDIAHMEINAAIDPARVDEFRRNAENAVRYAETLGTRNVNCLSGISSRCPDVPVETQLRIYEENLAYLCGLAGRSGLTVLIEPICRRSIPDYLFCDLHESVRFIERMGLDNIALQFDFYHVQMSNGDLTNNLERYADLIRYVQIAGVPGRDEPDHGEINYRHLLHELERRGYTGYVGLEYIPSLPPEQTFAWIRRMEE